MLTFWGTVVAASITGVCGIIAGLITMVIQHGSTKKLIEYRMTGVEEGIKEIKDTIVPTIPMIEKEIAVMKEKIATMEKDIESLKRKGDDGR